MSAPKTVLILDYNNVPQMLSGHSLIAFLRHLDSSRYRAVVVFNRIGEYSAAASRSAAETIILPHGGGNLLKRTWQYGRLVLSLWLLARRVRPCLIYANNVMAARPAVVLKALTGLPVIVHIRNTGFYPRTAPLALRADQFLTVSRSTAEGTLPPDFQNRATIVYDGIELPEFPVADPDSRLRSRLKLNLPSTGYLVGMAGRLTAQKGQRCFLEMAKRICAQRKDVFFVHAGGVPSSKSREPYEQLLAAESAGLTESNQFRWLPYIEDMATFWSALDVAVVPSAGPEAFSRAVIEAMASGPPVVATHSGGPDEIIEHAETGLLVSMQDASALVRAVMQLLNDAELRGRISSNARCAVEERFSAERYAAKIAEVFDHVVLGHMMPGSVSPRRFKRRIK